MKKLLPLLILVIALVAIVMLLKVKGPNDKPATVWEQKTEVKVDARALFDEFVQDEQGANEKYLNKIVEVSGEVSTTQASNGSNSVVLRTNDPTYGVRCRLERGPGEDVKNYKVGQSLTLKCVCSGYVQDVEMVQCVEK